MVKNGKRIPTEEDLYKYAQGQLEQWKQQCSKKKDMTK